MHFCNSWKLFILKNKGSDFLLFYAAIIELVTVSVLCEVGVVSGLHMHLQKTLSTNSFCHWKAAAGSALFHVHGGGPLPPTAVFIEARVAPGASLNDNKTDTPCDPAILPWCLLPDLQFLSKISESTDPMPWCTHCSSPVHGTGATNCSVVVKAAKIWKCHPHYTVHSRAWDTDVAFVLYHFNLKLW